MVIAKVYPILVRARMQNDVYIFNYSLHSADVLGFRPDHHTNIDWYVSNLLLFLF